MEVKLRGLDRYEVEAIQYDGTNSDEICQRENQSSIQLVWERYTTGSRSNTGVRRNDNQRKPKPVVRELREFTVKGHTIMAYSRKDAITRLKLQKKI